MKWYDAFSNFYDSSLEKLYFDSRKRAVELLDLDEGQTVLDVACGTGANFKHLMASGKQFDLFGVDYSEGMLAKAKKQIDINNWNSIQLRQSDARRMSLSDFSENGQFEKGFDRILCVLGLSVIPDWEKVLHNLLSLLNTDGKIVVVDVYAEKRNFYTWMVEKIAKADLDREIWQTIKKNTQNFQHEYLPVKENKVGGKLFVAVGSKG